jgi:amino acid adenylation domain-containing protein
MSLNDMAASTARLSPEKRALLEQLKSSIRSTPRAGIPPRPPAGRPPLSFAQRRLWFLNQMVPGSPAYNVPMSFRLGGHLRHEILERAVAEIVRRHETLRTTLPSENGEPWQEIAAHATVPIELVDLSGEPAPARETALERLVGAAARRPFDLAAGPLLRVTLFRLEPELHVVLLNAHHVIVDGWSLGLFWHELLTLYDAFAAGRPSPLAEPPIQYADFAVWQREHLAGGRLETQLAYWRDQLGDGTETLELPFDRARPPVQTFEGRDLELLVPKSLRGELAALGKREGVSLFVVLLGALNVLLHRFTGQDDIAIGSPVTNRTHTDIEQLIGLFVNTLVYKVDLGGEMDFRQVMSRTQDVVNAAQRHQEVPFEAVVEALQPERYLSQNPLFQVCFNFLPARDLDSGAALTVLEIKGIRNDTAKFDLWISVVDRERDLLVEVEYDSAVFDEATVRRILDGYRVLLEAVAADGAAAVAELPVMTPADRHVIERWGGVTAPAETPGRLLHELFEAQAATAPDAVAVTFEGEDLTYGALNAKANSLAHRLRREGAGPGTLVGLCAERSAGLVVGILGILKSGAAYVPIDPDYPVERIAFLLADSGAPILVTRRDLVERLPETRAELVLLDDGADAPDGHEDDPGRAPGATPLDPAYVIYTSGSTGSPKGVLVRHANVARLFTSTDHWFGFGPHDTWTLFHSFTFDFSVWELWGALAHGGRLVVVPYWVSRSPESFYELIRDERVTVLNQTPLAFRHLMSAEEEVLGPNAAPDLALRLVVFGGEELDVRSLRPWWDGHGDHTPLLVNMYGITETTVHVTYRPLSRADLGAPSSGSPIGRPIRDLRVQVLDRYGQPCAIGVRGELYVGGAGVAAGYLNRPALTAERFLPDPTAGDPDARLYRTGDLVRWRPDGELEYLERADDQVKISGHRIELGEIEAALSEHPKVREVVVLARAGKAGKRLVAYVVPRSAPDGGAAQPADGAPRGLEWEAVFDRAYGDGATVAADFNVAGWDSSYTGEPLPDADMREWVDTTVARILALAPRRVLEIGCGTGLLLSRIAPRCEVYHGTDISRTALDHVRARLLAPRADLSHVRVHQRGASDFSGFGDERFDLVVINSVVQYFPDAGYLREVLEKALECVAGGGVVFVGDVRNLALLETFHADVELHQAAPALPVERLTTRVRQRVAQDEELVLHPDAFRTLRRKHPNVRRVELQLRRGTCENEMTRYRYDALLHVGGPTAAPAAPPARVNWQRDGLTLGALEECLRCERPEALVVLSVPNSRLTAVNARLARLAELDGSDTVAELSGLAGAEDETAVHPDAWWRLAERLGYSACVEWMPGTTDGSYAVLLSRGIDRHGLDAWLAGERPEPTGRWDDYASDPVFSRQARALAPELRAYLAERLPDYMVPTGYVALKRYPLNANGKLDRAALPPPSLDAADRDGALAPARTPTEQALAAVWAEVLGVETVGVGSNFFALGGDSIHSIHVVTKAKQRGLELTPRMIFQHGTLAELAAALDGGAQRRPATAEIHASGDGRPVPLAALRADPDVQDVYPLAPFQEWALRVWRSSPTPGAFQVHRLTAVPRALANNDLFRQALELQAATYPAMRTAFAWDGLDEPVQVVHRGPVVELEVADWRGLSPAEQDAALERHLKADRERGIDPAVPGGMRYFVADVSDDTCVVVISLSYLCLDGWSFDILANQLTETLQALAAGARSEPQLGPGFKEFVTHVRGQDQDRARRYWRRALGGLRQPTMLSRHVPGNAPGSERGFGRQWISLPRELSSGLRETARQRRLTVNVLFQAAWAATVAAFTGPAAPGEQIDLAHGVLLTGRSSGPEGVGAIVGPTMNILPLRTRLDPAEPVSAFLPRVTAELVEVGGHENTALHDALACGDLPDGQLPCESYVVFQNVGLENSERYGPAYYISRMGFPLRLDVFPTNTITVHMSYYRELFTDTTVTRLIGAYSAVLEALAADQDRSLRDVMATARQDRAAPPDLGHFREGEIAVADVCALAGEAT